MYFVDYKRLTAALNAAVGSGRYKLTIHGPVIRLRAQAAVADAAIVALTQLVSGEVESVIYDYATHFTIRNFKLIEQV